MSALASRTRWARQLTLGCLVVLLVVLSVEIYGIVRLAPETRAFLWVIWVLPLLLFLPGLVRGNWKSYLWLCFVVLVYFMVTVSELFGPEREIADVFELMLIVVLFIAAMMYARWRQRELAGAEVEEPG